MEHESGLARRANGRVYPRCADGAFCGAHDWAYRMNAKDWLSAVHDLPCVLCAELGQSQSTATAAHHIRHGAGLSQRASDFLVCALCYDCHQGPNGLHGNRSLFSMAHWTELDSLAATIKAMARKASW